jgi:hypothetical protein
MSQHRKITVGKDNPAWQEYDREVLAEVWHNAYETSALRLTHEEARTLHVLLGAYLEATAP